jgi:hypothetical protein
MIFSTTQEREKPVSMDFMRFLRIDAVENYVTSILIPEGMHGDLQFATKFGTDSIQLCYAEEFSGQFRRIGDTPSVQERSDAHRFLHSGLWKLYAYNETEGRFENIIAEIVCSDGNSGTILVGATSRGPEKEKTFVAYEIRLYPTL